MAQQNIHSCNKKKNSGRSIRRRGYIAVPNSIILAADLYPTDKKLFVAMLGASYGHRCRKTYDELVALSGLSRRTVATCLVRLEEAGLIQHKEHTYFWHDPLGRLVRGSNVYYLKKRDLSEGYTLIPRSLLDNTLSPCAFVAAMEIYHQAGREGRSYGSLRHMAKILDMVKATVCRCLHQFRKSQAVSFIHCRYSGKRSYACNSYYPVDFVRSGQFGVNGGLNVALPICINKITGDSIGKEKIYGVAQFGKIAKFEDHWVIEVFADDAPDDICA